MKLLILFLIITGTLLPQSECKKYHKNFKPKNLSEAIEYLDCVWTKKNKMDFRKIPEDEAVSDAHFASGLWIRNNWLSESELELFFNKHKVFHGDDISSIILTSFHRKLNNREIDFEGQVKDVLEYWAPIIKREEDGLRKAMEAYSYYQIGDTISFYLEIDVDEDGKSGIMPLDEWIFDPEKDLKCKGIVLSKILYEDDVQFEIKIINMNISGKVKIIGEETEVGNSIYIDLKYLKFDQN